MLAICNATEPVVFKAPKTSSNAERVPHGTKTRAKPGHKKHSTSSTQPSMSRKEATKGGSSKAPTGSKTSHLKRKKESNSAMDSNLSQTSASTPLVAKIHKEDQQATSGPTSLGVTYKARANLQLNSDQTKSVCDSLPKSSSQPEGEHIKKDKGKNAMSSEKAKKESNNSDSNDDDETHVSGFMVEPSTIKKLKKFDFITKDERKIHLTEEEINHQKKLEENAKAKAAEQEGDVRKAKLFDLLGPEVVNKYYNDKL
nr:hypothetical protein [Tanacetum cinerariifolium]